jgi:hypothetical protein
MAAIFFSRTPNHLNRVKKLALSHQLKETTHRDLHEGKKQLLLGLPNFLFLLKDN